MELIEIIKSKLAKAKDVVNVRVNAFVGQPVYCKTACDYTEEYYGYKCKMCNHFIPYGCEPWLPDECLNEEGYAEL